MMQDFGHGWGMGFGWIIGIIIILAILWLVFRIFRPDYSDRSPEKKSALDILKERYATGEIDKEEYLERKKNLL